jgi:hypothetical protein
LLCFGIPAARARLMGKESVSFRASVCVVAISDKWHPRSSPKCMVRRATNVWSAAGLQGKSVGLIDRSAQMYSAFVWRAQSPGHDELRCVLFLINGTVIADHFREQVSSTPLGTVRSS